MPEVFAGTGYRLLDTGYWIALLNEDRDSGTGTASQENSAPGSRTPP